MKVYRPVMSRVRAAARRHGLNPRQIKRSTRRHKKLMILNPDTGSFVHFGDTRYSNFTIHRNRSRRAAYLRRSRGMPHPRMSPNWLAIKLLWDG